MYRAFKTALWFRVYGLGLRVMYMLIYIYIYSGSLQQHYGVQRMFQALGFGLLKDGLSLQSWRDPFT